MPMSLPDLSRSEYEILQLLWRDDVSSVRQLHEQLDNGWAYSTTKTTMDRMVKKGLLNRALEQGSYVYRALITRPRGMVKMLCYLADKVLKVEPEAVVSMFASSHQLSGSEITELNKLIAQQQRD